MASVAQRYKRGRVWFSELLGRILHQRSDLVSKLVLQHHYSRTKLSLLFELIH
jgi:hypothetical protein